jgi:hypothetical protein
MAKFNIVRARGTLPGRAAAVRADLRGDLDVRTGAGLVAGAIARAGGALADIGEDYYNIEAITQESKAKRKATEEIHRLGLSFNKITDPSTYDAEFLTSIGKITTEFVPKNKRASSNYHLWLDAKTPTWRNAVEESKLLRAAKNYDGELAEKIAQIEQTGELGGVAEFLAGGVKEGLIEKSNAVEILARLNKMSDETKSRKILESQAESIAIKENSWKAAERWLAVPENTKGLPSEIVDSVLEDVSTKARVEDRIKQERLETDREAQRNEFYERLDKKNFDGLYNFLQSSSLEENEQQKLWSQVKAETERIARGEQIITDQGVKHMLLDVVADLNWPERGVDAREVKKRAWDARYGSAPRIDDSAYDEIRDAIRQELKDEIPFTRKYIEQIMGELETGAPSSVLGLPLPTLRTREDALRHATNAFGRFVDRIPGVRSLINKYPPSKTGTSTELPKENPAHDWDGTLIGTYNPDGSITLNREGVRRLWELAGRSAEKAREMALQHRYVIPETKEPLGEK